MDGVGLNPSENGNAVKKAKTPNLDYLYKNFPHSSLKASEKYVGLPEKQVGNSEVGHLNIGAGRIVYTGLSIINNAIEKNEFEKNESFLNALNHCKKHNSKLHIIGLISSGGVHSSLEHLLNLIKMLEKQNDVNVILHAFSDGRDVDKKSFLSDLNNLNPLLEKARIKLGSIGGRYYAMDRDNNWDRVEKEYNTLIGKETNSFNNPFEYIGESYNNNVYDEYIPPALNSSYKKDEIIIDDNDSVIFINYRPDRARELSHMIFNSSAFLYQNERKKNIYFVTMMKYDGISPSSIAFDAMKIKNSLAEVIEENNLFQLRIAETEKYAHVTFFFDGGEEKKYEHETKIIIPSSKVSSYALIPEMSAYKICDELINNMNNNDFIVCNFANGDMVGHTGNFDATVRAVEVVDECIGKIYQESLKNDYTLFITADHGNADEMINEKNEIVTSHSIHDVPFLITDNKIKNLNFGKLSDIAPTILKYLEIKIPKEMDGEILF